MAERTGIEWTDATWNPIVGCSIRSPGCTNCYAMSMARRIEAMQPGSHYAGTTRVVNGRPVWTGNLALAPKEILFAPLRWKKLRVVFVNSMGDLFHEKVADRDIDAVFAVMMASSHKYIVLTKRDEHMRDYVTAPDLTERIFNRQVDMGLFMGADQPADNIWLGSSVEDQRRADERRSAMAAIAAQGWNTFVSYEPALGLVDWQGWEFLAGIISGGESGRDARPTHPVWHMTTRDFCASHGIPFFFKQWGAYAPLLKAAPVIASNGANVAWPDGTFGVGSAEAKGGPGQSLYVGTKSVTGRLLDGREHNELAW